jgi:voltage-gated potassium channel
LTADNKLKTILIGILLFTIVNIIGTVGYVLIENTGFLDALYMTVITITTVGFGEIFPLSQMGRLFTIFLVLAGASTVAYTASQIIEIIIAGEIRRGLRRKKMDKKISKLKNHYVICGYGRMGRIIVNKLAYKKLDFVIVDKNENLVHEFDEKKYLYVIGDATKETTLMRAGILNAKGVITVVNSDTENVYIILSSRGFNKSLYIISRASSEEAITKMVWAGADKTVSPYDIGGMTIADSILKPNVAHFFELAMGTELNIEVDEIKVEDNSKIKNKKIRESNIRDAGIIIVAIRKPDGSFIFNPGPNEIILGGDTLIALGQEEAFKKLEL